VAEQGGKLDSKGQPSFSLDLWVSSLYSILSTANYYWLNSCSHKGCVSLWYWQPQLMNYAVLGM